MTSMELFIVVLNINLTLWWETHSDIAAERERFTSIAKLISTI